MSEYSLDQAHTLLRDVRETAKLTQTELALRLLVAQALIARREAPDRNIRLATIAAHCDRCGRVLKLRIAEALGERIITIGRTLGKLPIFTLAGIASECGVRVLLRVEQL